MGFYFIYFSSFFVSRIRTETTEAQSDGANHYAATTTDFAFNTISNKFKDIKKFSCNEIGRLDRKGKNCFKV